MTPSSMIHGLVLVLLSIAALCMPRLVVASEGYTVEVCNVGKGGLSFSVDGKFLHMSGGICPYDGRKFKAFLSTVDPAVRVIKLKVDGGNGPGAMAVGKLIREGGFDTFVDARTDVCASACTHLFAAGNKRFYVGARDGLFHVSYGKGGSGLGYHYPNASHTNADTAETDRYFESKIVPYLQNMLPAEAAQTVANLMSGNRTTKMTWLGAKQAHASGIATSLDLPE